MRYSKASFKILRYTATALILTILQVSTAHAAGSGMPWEGPLEQILTSLSGPVARVIGVAAIIVTGLGIAFGEGGSGMRRMLWAVRGAIRDGFDPKLDLSWTKIGSRGHFWPPLARLVLFAKQKETDEAQSFLKVRAQTALTFRKELSTPERA